MRSIICLGYAVQFASMATPFGHTRQCWTTPLGSTNPAAANSQESTSFIVRTPTSAQSDTTKDGWTSKSPPSCHWSVSASTLPTVPPSLSANQILCQLFEYNKIQNVCKITHQPFSIASICFTSTTMADTTCISTQLHPLSSCPLSPRWPYSAATLCYLPPYGQSEHDPTFFAHSYCTSL